MKIDFNSAVGMYRANKPTAVQKGAKEAPETAKTDVAEFSHSASPALSKAYTGAKSSIVSGVNASADPSRIEALKQSVREGAYHIPTDDIVKAILEDA